MRRLLPPPTLENLYPPARGYRYFDADALPPFDASSGTAPANRWWMAEHALLSYDGPEVIDPVLRPLGYRVHYLQHRDSSTFAYVAVGADHGIVAFRGTEVIKRGAPSITLADVARDWLTDVRFARVGVDDGGLAHGGFVRALDTVWPALAAALPEAHRWFCCGHSLGGALAALAALRIAATGHALAGVVTFGQPRTGDRAVAQRLDALPCVRLVNACDIVPRLPLAAMGFAHSNSHHHLDGERFTRYPATVLEHLAQLPSRLRHGLGALTPVELIDHAPLHYAIKCYNAALSK